MSPATYNLLFLCTGNSTRSIFAEALTRHVDRGRRFHAYSAGSTPKGAVNPLVLQALKEFGIDSNGLRSKSWDEFAAPGAPVMDIVITVCDKAAAETCPVWPGQPVTAHWGMSEPEDDTDPLRRIQELVHVLRRRIELLASLPAEKLDRLALETRVREIGGR